MSTLAELARTYYDTVDTVPADVPPLFASDAVYKRPGYPAFEGADALVVCTEWEQFRAFDAQLLTSRMAGRVIVDGRNLWDPEQVAAAGFAYASIGRVTTRPSAAPDRD